MVRHAYRIGGLQDGFRTMRRECRFLAVIGAVALSVATAASVFAQDVPLLRSVSPGEWQLHEIGESAPNRMICVRSADQLVQLQHGAAECERLAGSQDGKRAVVSYRCPAHGHGRTVITEESDALLRIQTQGIADGAPFNVDYEARRIGK